MKEKKKNKWKKSDVASNQGQSLNLIRFGQTKFFCFTDKGNTSHSTCSVGKAKAASIGKDERYCVIPYQRGWGRRRRCCKDAPTSE